MPVSVQGTDLLIPHALPAAMHRAVMNAFKITVIKNPPILYRSWNINPSGVEGLKALRAYILHAENTDVFQVYVKKM
jgi:hypothetical protein